MTSCSVCKTDSPLHLCNRHIKYLDEALDEIPWLHSQLQTTITRTDKLNMGVSGRKSSESPSPINWGASRLSDELLTILRSWIDRMVDENGLRFLPRWSVPHGFIGPLPLGWRRLPIRGYSGSLQQMVAWIKHHLNVIAGREDAGDRYFEVINLTGDPDSPRLPPGRLVASINTRTKRWAGPCPEIKGYSNTGEQIFCSEILYAINGADIAECGECKKANPPRSFTVDVTQNLLRVRKEQDALTEARLYEAMAGVGKKLYSDLLQRWLKTGRLKPTGYFCGDEIRDQPRNSKDPRLFSFKQVQRLWDQHKAELKEVAS